MEAPDGLRERLLEVTAELLATEGVERVSLREIARRAGVSHGAPLRHYPSLAHLLSHVAAEGFDRLFAAVGDAIAHTQRRPPVDRLRAAAQAYVRFALANPGHYTLMFRPDLLDAAELTALAPDAFGQLVDLVVEVQAAGWHSADDPVRLSGAMWAVVHGVSSLWLQGAMGYATGATDVHQILDPALDTILGPPNITRRRQL